jgi:hypothetical protein
MRALVVLSRNGNSPMRSFPEACQRIIDDASTSLPFNASAAARCNLGCRGDAAVRMARRLTDPENGPQASPPHAFFSKAR